MESGYVCISHIKVFFTYKTTFPTLTSVYPQMVPFEGGTNAIIAGENFRINMNLFCFFSDEKRTALFIDSEHVLCVVPPLSNIEKKKTTSGTESGIVTSSLSVVFSDQSDYAKANLSMVLGSGLDISYYRQPVIKRVVPSSLNIEEYGMISVVVDNMINTNSVYCKFQSINEASKFKVVRALLDNNLIECEAPTWDCTEQVELSITLNGQNYNDPVVFEYTKKTMFNTKLMSTIKYILLAAFGCGIITISVLGISALRKRNYSDSSLSLSATSSSPSLIFSRKSRLTSQSSTSTSSSSNTNDAIPTESTFLIQQNSPKSNQSVLVGQTYNSINNYSNTESPKHGKKGKRSRSRRKKTRSEKHRQLMFNGSEIILLKKMDQEELPVAYDIFMGKWKGSFVSVKLLRANAVCEESLSLFESEVSVLRCLRSPAIVEYFGNIYNRYSSTYAIVTEHMELGKLFDVLHDSSDHAQLIEWPVLLRMLKDIAIAVNYLHASGFVLLNMTSKYFVVNKNFQVKFSALSSLHNNNSDNNSNGNESSSSSRKKRRDPFDKCVSPNLWCSPEVLTGESSSSASLSSDSYSFGMIMWEFVTRQLPFFGAALEDVVDRVISDGMRPEVPMWCPWQYADLVQDCWDPTPEARLTFPAIIKALGELSGLGWMGVPRDAATAANSSLSSSSCYSSSTSASPPLSPLPADQSSPVKYSLSQMQPQMEMPPSSPPALSNNKHKKDEYKKIYSSSPSSSSSDSSSFTFSSDEYL